MAKTTATACREMAIACFLQLISHDPLLVLKRVAKRKRVPVLRLILTFILMQMYANKADTLAQGSAVIAKRSPAERIDTSPIRK
jgi:hypothetical protein